MITKKIVCSGILSALLAITAGAAQASPGRLVERNVTMALGGDQTVAGASIEYSCRNVSEAAGWLLGESCEGTVKDAAGSVVFRTPVKLVAVSPVDQIGGLAVPAPGATEDKVTCAGNLRQCGPGSNFHGACEQANGGFEGSNPSSGGIPQTYSCNVP